MRYRVPPYITEVTGHCLRCRDLFDLEIEVQGGIAFLSPTQTAVQQDGRIVHRPGLCGGDVKLFGQAITRRRRAIPAGSGKVAQPDSMALV